MSFKKRVAEYPVKIGEISIKYTGLVNARRRLFLEGVYHGAEVSI